MPEDKNNSFAPNNTPQDTPDNSESQPSALEQPQSFESEPTTTPASEPTTAPAPEVEPATTAPATVSSTEAGTPTAAATPPVQPQSLEQPLDNQPNAFAQPPKKSKKKWIIAGVVSLIAVLLLGSGVFAYVMYQSPQKLLGDAIAGLYQARAASGTISYTQTKSNGTKVDVTFTTASKESEYSLDVTAKINANSKDYTVKGAGAYDKDGNVYFKLSGLKDALSKTSSSDLPAEITSLFDKYENKWVKVEAKDLRELSSSAEKSQTCFKELNQKLSQQSFRKDVETTYRQHQFVVVKDELGVKDGNVGYQIDVDKAVADEFEKAFKQTGSYKELESICDGTLTKDSSSLSSRSRDDNSKNAKVNVWISQWAHKLEKAEFSTSDALEKSNAVVNFDYDKSVDVKIPTDTVSIKQLIEDVQEVYKGASSSASSRAMTRESSVSNNNVRTMESTALRTSLF